jgi:hypothetical protein
LDFEWKRTTGEGSSAESDASGAGTERGEPGDRQAAQAGREGGLGTPLIPWRSQFTVFPNNLRFIAMAASNLLATSTPNLKNLLGNGRSYRVLAFPKEEAEAVLP